MLPQLAFALLSSLVFAAPSIPELEALLKMNPDKISARMQLADAQFKARRFDQVVALLNPYTDQLSDEGFLMLGSAYSQQKDYLNEVRTLSVISARKEADHRWHMLLAQAYIKHSSTLPKDKQPPMLTLAIQNLRKTLELQPKYKPAFDLLLNTLLQQKANNEARELLVEGISKFGQRADLYRELCRVDSTDGYLVQALDNCRIAIKLAPTYPDNYVYLVQTLHDQGEHEAAERNVISAARKFPKSEFVQWAAGTVFIKKKNYPVAARYFGAGLRADPKAVRSEFGLAQSLFESGDEEAALEHFTKACAADKSTFDVFLAAGQKIKQKGNSSLGGKYTQGAYACRN